MPGEALEESGAPPQAGAEGARLVAFDFDGTLTTTDSFNAFLRWRTKPTALPLRLLSLFPAVAVYLVRCDRGRLKSAAVRVFLRGCTRTALGAEAARFMAEAWDRLMRPDALARWAAHKASGDRLVVVTASPEELVAPFAQRLGADALIGSRLAWTPEERVGAGLEGPNCRGPQKVARLREAFGPDVKLAVAYGDTSGDREMLGFAATGYLRLFQSRPTARAVSRGTGARSRPSGSPPG